MPDAYICRDLRRTKITRKACDTAEYIEFFLSPEIVMHDSVIFVNENENYEKRKNNDSINEN